MPGIGGLGCVFQRRRKRNGSSRRWAIKSKKPPRSSALPTAPVPDNQKKEVTMEETNVQSTKALTKLSIGALFSAVRHVMQKCRKICSGFLNIFFFWRGYAERVESLHQKVDELQREITLLHSTLKLYREVKTAGGQCAMPDGVQLFAPLPVALPPPPPPPPPPLPLPKIVVTPAALKVPIISKTSAKTSSLKEKQNDPVAVTLRDLQAVRLRKVTVGLKAQLSPERRRSPLVTLADLQKVRLRRSNSDLPIKIKSSLARTPTKNGMSLRVPLRKVNLMRSPGGTPLCNKENDIMDSSLDLSMTRGLGNKHLRALTKGLSPIKSV